MSPKFYIKAKVNHERVYYPMVEGVIFDNIPCDTATEAQERGIELFNMAVEARRASAYTEEEGE